MTQVGTATQADCTTKAQDPQPFTPPKDEMRAKLQALLTQTVKKAEDTDAKSLVGRALQGTKDGDPFS